MHKGNLEILTPIPNTVAAARDSLFVRSTVVNPDAKAGYALRQAAATPMVYFDVGFETFYNQGEMYRGE